MTQMHFVCRNMLFTGLFIQFETIETQFQQNSNYIGLQLAIC